MDLNKLADVLVPDTNVKALDDYEQLYPARNLPDGAQVTRLAPSPPGFIHLGNLFVAIANERIAHQSQGTRTRRDPPSQAPPVLFRQTASNTHLQFRTQRILS